MPRTSQCPLNIQAFHLSLRIRSFLTSRAEVPLWYRVPLRSNSRLNSSNLHNNRRQLTDLDAVAVFESGRNVRQKHLPVQNCTIGRIEISDFPFARFIIEFDGNVFGGDAGVFDSDVTIFAYECQRFLLPFIRQLQSQTPVNSQPPSFSIKPAKKHPLLS
uniref:Uncharacterized protein n=1 Tax=Lactuca sativa TaxID=4236 RepID=A0A9R1VTU7_LACSA|nr:hypothetical protein LSAT_V11C400212910 [Lactuca sativa]